MESPILCKKLLGMFVVSVTGLGNALWMELGEQPPVFCLLLSILNISPLFFFFLSCSVSPMPTIFKYIQ